MVRCFVAVDTISDTLKDLAIKVKGLLEEEGIRASYQSPNTLHITLKFLGEIDMERVEDVIAVLSKIKGPIFNIEVCGFGGFPNLRRPRVLFFNVKESQELYKIFRKLELDLSKLGFPRERRAFKPHITIARIKTFRSLSNKVYSYLTSYDFREIITIRQIKFKESILTPNGAIYKDIHSINLGEQGAEQ